MDNQSFFITVSPEDARHYQRLDQFLVAQLASKSRSFIKKIFEQEGISIAAHSPYQGKLELKKMPPEGTIIELDIPPPMDSTVEAQNIPLEVLYEDEHLLFIYKPAGMVTHPAPGHYRHTLVNALLYHVKDLSGIGQVKRPGIVHRLDKGTSGVMVVAKTQECHEKLVLLFSRHDLTRRYQAIALGNDLPAEGWIESCISRDERHRKRMKSYPHKGKRAKTFYKVLKRFQHFSHVECQLETGRTHQIRVHFAQDLHHPLLGDETYGNLSKQKKLLPPKGLNLLESHPFPFLHAHHLSMKHPMKPQLLSFEAPLPPIFQDMLDCLDS